MRPTILVLVATFALLVPLAGAGTLQPAAVAPQREIVMFADEPGLAPGDSYLGEPVVDANHAIHFIVVVTSNPVLFEAKARLDPRVKYTQIDDPLAAVLDMTPNDARWSDAGMYGARIIGAPTAWDRTLGAASVKVGLVDSGILKTHEEWVGTGRVLQGYDFVNNDNDPDDQCGHGTHTSGTIGASINNAKGIAGIAPQVTLLMAKAFTPNILGQCGGSTAALANALTYMGDQGVQVSSNSWGSRSRRASSSSRPPATREAARTA
jgi:thermitase